MLIHAVDGEMLPWISANTDLPVVLVEKSGSHQGHYVSVHNSMPIHPIVVEIYKSRPAA